MIQPAPAPSEPQSALELFVRSRMAPVPVEAFVGVGAELDDEMWRWLARPYAADPEYLSEWAI